MRIALVNPPFANFRRPSIGLTQLRASIRERLPDVQVDIHNINLDCVPLLGADWYNDISDGFQSWTGLGEWLFRPLVFPDTPSNAEAYVAWLRRPKTGWLTASAAEDRAHLSQRVLESQKILCDTLPALIDKRALSAYDVVGVTSMFAQNLAALAILRLVKLRNPAVITLMGGANCESPMGDALLEKFAFVDRVFSGRSIGSLPAFLHAYRQSRELNATPQIPGVLRRDNPGAPQAFVRAPLAMPVDSAAASTCAAPASGQSRTRTFETPPLDYDDFIEEIRAAPFETDIVLSFETSAGCWWGEKSHCTFCGLNSTAMEYRALDADRAIAIIHTLIAKYSHVCRTFEAVDNILPHTYFRDVLPRLRVPEHVSLFYEIKANLSEAQVQELAAAGVRKIQPGIESLSSETTRLLRKGVEGVQSVALLRNCRAEHIEVDWNLLVAVPGESLSTYLHVLREAPKLVHLEPPAGALDIRFDRYSPYFNHPSDFGLELVPYQFYSFLYPFDEPWLSRVAYFFDSAGETSCGPEGREAVATLRDLITEWRRRWSGDSRPVLEVKAKGATLTVIDTRDAASPLEHVLDEAERVTLDCLRQPRTLAHLPRLLGERGIPATDAERAIAFVRDRRWLFEEEARAVSIVVDRRRESLMGQTPQEPVLEQQLS